MVQFRESIFVAMARTYITFLSRLTAVLLLVSITLPVPGEQQRKEFNVPLPFLSVAFDNAENFQEVFITYGSIHEGWAIGDIDDRYVKDTRRLRLDHLHKELPRQAYMLSPFEVEVLDRVCNSFYSALSTFENDLRDRKWDRVAYIDMYFPVVFRGFYWLFTAAKNNREALPKVTDIDTTFFDNSLSTVPRSDARIGTWQKNPEHVIKLRIAAKELQFQIKKWQKADLNLGKRDPWEDNSLDLVQTYELFIRLYFNLPKDIRAVKSSGKAVTKAGTKTRRTR